MIRPFEKLAELHEKATPKRRQQIEEAVDGIFDKLKNSYALQLMDTQPTERPAVIKQQMCGICKGPVCGKEKHAHAQYFQSPAITQPATTEVIEQADQSDIEESAALSRDPEFSKLVC